MLKVAIRLGNYGISVKKLPLITAVRFAHLTQLSPYDVNLILRENEYATSFHEDDSVLYRYESNQLVSNNPCEDAYAHGTFIHQKGFICGVFDGHAGSACAQVVSKRLLRYIASSLVDHKILKDQIAMGCDSQSFLRCHNDKVDFVKDIKEIYESSFKEYLYEIHEMNENDKKVIECAERIENAFLCLDRDISKEALQHTNMRTMSVAMSGSVACVAHIDNIDLHVASTGDSSAVLGIQHPDTSIWQAIKLNTEHNTDNRKEVERILNEHPKDEQHTIIRKDRLLGQLAPLRALGDFRYKWSHEIMERLVIPVFGENIMPTHYYTPPYLTAKPDVQHHRLRPEDKFLIIASDGLWDFLSPLEAVTLVGEHLTSKRKFEPMKGSTGVKLDEIFNTLAERKAGESRKPVDQNSATHLIRHALGGTDYGIEHSRISYYLTLPEDIVRLYRDDITITVIYFNSDYIKNSIR